MEKLNVYVNKLKELQMEQCENCQYLITILEEYRKMTELMLQHIEEMQKPVDWSQLYPNTTIPYNPYIMVKSVKPPEIPFDGEMPAPITVRVE